MQELVHKSRRSLAAGGLHNLTHESVERLFLAGAVLLHHGGILRENFVHHRFNRARIGNLLETELTDQSVDIRLFALPDRGKDFLRALQIDRAVRDTAHDRGERVGRHRSVLDRKTFRLIESGAHFTHHPVRGSLLILHLVREGVVVLRDAAARRENTGIVFGKAVFLLETLEHLLRQLGEIRLETGDFLS